MTGSTPFTIQDHQYNFMREKHHSPAAALSLLGQSQVYWLLSQSMLADCDVTSLPIHSFRAVEESGIDRRAVSKTKKGGSERRRGGGGLAIPSEMRTFNECWFGCKMFRIRLGNWLFGNHFQFGIKNMERREQRWVPGCILVCWYKKQMWNMQTYEEKLT